MNIHHINRVELSFLANYWALLFYAVFERGHQFNLIDLVLLCNGQQLSQLHNIVRCILDYNLRIITIPGVYCIFTGSGRVTNFRMQG